jgi:hypothetical protein
MELNKAVETLSRLSTEYAAVVAQQGMMATGEAIGMLGNIAAETVMAEIQKLRATIATTETPTQEDATDE